MQYNKTTMEKVPNIPAAPQKEDDVVGEKTEAQKKAQQKYMEKFAVARVRMDREKYDLVQAHAESRGESVNGFINRAIDTVMQQDKETAGE